MFVQHSRRSPANFSCCSFGLYLFTRFFPALGAVNLIVFNVSSLSVAQLEAALGVFYAPPTPLSDMVILEYRDPVRKYARRFFHHLLR